MIVLNALNDSRQEMAGMRRFLVHFPRLGRVPLYEPGSFGLLGAFSPLA